MKHTCHANSCDNECKPEHLVCSRCWKYHDTELAKAVYKHYTPGQCSNVNKIKPEWLRAARLFLNDIAKKRGVFSKKPLDNTQTK